MAVIIETNNTQTPITDELFAQYPAEIKEQFMEFVNTVPYIANLISPSRPEIKDLPKDSLGRAIIDITNPPIFRNTKWFSRVAQDYELNDEIYTKLRPNSNPNSEYRKFWQREVDRIYDGCLREDGMWIPGYFYWELNYVPMLINEIKKGSKRAIRKVGFPKFFDQTYLRFLYLDSSIEEGNHGAELAKRGAGKAHPYSSNVYTPEGLKKWGDIKVGDRVFTPYGTETKVVAIPFDEETEIYEFTLRDGRKVKSSGGHLWDVIWRGKHRQMTTLEVLNNYKQIRKVSDRIPNGIEYIIGIPKNEGVDWKEFPTKVDPYTFGLLLGDGCFRHASCYYTCSDDDFAFIKNYIPYNYTKWSSKFAYRLHIENWNTILDNYGLNNLKSEDKFIPDEYKFNSRRVRTELLKGLIDSDGTIGKNKRYSIALSSKRMIEDIAFICRSLGYNCHYTSRKRGYKKDGEYIECLPTYELLIYTEDILAKLPRKQVKEIFNSSYSSSKFDSTKIINVEYVGRERAKCVTVEDSKHEYLIEDFITTHNSYFLASVMSRNLLFGKSRESAKRWTTVLTAYQKEYLKGDKDGTLSKFEPTLAHVYATTPFPHLMLKSSSNEMVWQMGYKNLEGAVDKKSSLNTVMGVSAKDDSDKLRGKRADILYEEFGNFNGLLELYDACRRGTEDGDFAFGTMFLVGTANNKESNFQSAKTLLYAPKAYNIHELPNVYDKKGQGNPKFAFFYPAYMNRAGCMDEDGNSDVVAALLQILMKRYDAKYGADPTSVLRVIAEDPITPAEAIIKVKDAYFPVQALTERAQSLDMNKSLYDDVYVGELYTDKKGEIAFRPTGDIPIRTYPVSNDTKGALEIYQMPEKDRDGKVFSSRYILGCLKEGERVNTNKGLKRVEEVTLDDKLISIEGKEISIFNLQRYININPVYKVKLAGIYDTTTFSDEHPIYCATPTYKYHKFSYAKTHNLPQKHRVLNFDFRRVKDVRVGDIVKSPVLYTEEKDVSGYWEDFGRIDRKVANPLNNKDFWWLIGLIIGDGWASGNGYSIGIAFNKKEMQYIKRAQHIVEELLGRNFVLAKERQNHVEYTFSYQYLNNFISTHIGRGAANKNIPEWIKYISKECKQALILGYLASDGSVTDNSIEFVSISKKLLNDFQEILFSLGVVSTNTLLRSARKHEIAGLKCTTLDTWHLRIANSDSWIVKSWSEDDLKLSKLIIKKDSTHRRKDIEFTEDKKYLLIRIKDIQVEEYQGYVYNYECDTHTFMCNYIPTHNCDPYDNDQAESSSLYSIFVLDLFTDTIVAEYTGRTNYADDAHEMVRKLCLFYNAKALYESNKKGLFSYMEKMRSTHLLADTPEYLRDRQLVKYSSFGSSAKGVNASAPINNFANGLIKDWLNKLVTTEVKDEEGNTTIAEVPLLYRLKNRALLEELIQFNPVMNFDRIRSLGMVMLYREEYQIKYQGQLNIKAREDRSKRYADNDDFFNRNYHVR